jgi:hypothetical protein
VRYGIVEGEPGIFPEPVARVLRMIGGLFGGKRKRTDESRPATGEGTTDATGTQAPGADDDRER